VFNTDHLFEEARLHPLVAAHRGVSSANIPCNTITAYGIALRQRADIVEIDVARSRDGRLYVFHPGMEPPHLHSERLISDMTAAEVDALRYVNQDDCPTPYRVNTLDEALDLMKDRCYINVDKFWTCMEEIAACIRAHGMEKQVIVKTPCAAEYFDELERVAPDFAFIPMVKKEDRWTDGLLKRNIRYAGAEVIFDSEDDPVASPGYIRAMHDRGLLVWANAIVYDSAAVISAHHTDDGALAGSPDDHWGWLLDRGFDIIQTDWCAMLKAYMADREKAKRGGVLNEHQN